MFLYLRQQQLQINLCIPLPNQTKQEESTKRQQISSARHVDHQIMAALHFNMWHATMIQHIPMAVIKNKNAYNSAQK